MPQISQFCFGKEKSSSIFARTFAKANDGSIVFKDLPGNERLKRNSILLQYHGEVGEWLKPTVC